MDFQSLQNDLKDWLKEKARAAASAARSVDSKVQRVENYLGITRPQPTPNPITSPKAFLKDQLITKPVQTVKNIVNPVLTGLNVATSYPLGGSVKALSEVKKGTYQAPNTGVKIMGLDAGNFINPSIVGAVRGIKNKQTLFEEVPKAAGVTNPVGAFALGLASELAVPVPGGKGKALNKVREVLNADNLSKILSNSLKLNPSKIADKPNRLVGERWSFQEALTGLTQTGKNLKGRIQIGIDDAKQLVLEDGTHLLEAYRQLRKPIPIDKIAFTSDKAKKVFLKLAGKSGDIVENITQATKPIQERIDTVLEKTKITEKTIRSGFTRAINIAKSQEEAAKNIGVFVDRIMETGDQKLKEVGQKAINAQLARFSAYKGNKKTEGLFQALENGFSKLQDVPFGPKGMFNRPDAPRIQTIPDKFDDLLGSLDPARPIRFPEIANVVGKLKDLASWRRGYSDIDRNFAKVFGEGSPAYKLVEEQVLQPFFNAKAAFTDEVTDLTTSLNENIEKGLGIAQDTKLSSIVQQFGEKRMSLNELQKTVPKEWQKVVEADKWFRSMYNRIIDDVNAVRAQIYPNNPEKLIPKREDYYRHFQELSDSFQGLKNILSGPNNISPSLAGISEFTKPRARWASFMQARTGDSTKLDAVGGFLDYIKASMYAKHIDPTIGNFLDLANDLRQVTKDEAGPVNNFIEYLGRFAGRLAGKTNSLDRGFMENIPGGRASMKALDLLNRKFRVNAILANVSATINQTLGIPMGIADAGVVNATKGLAETVKNVFQEGASAQSKWLKERYLDSAFDQFDHGMINNTKNGAKWLMRLFEETSTRFIWNMEHQRALSEGVKDAVEAANKYTRKIVVGRGIGEIPLIQDSKIFQTVLPFQAEVANQWLVFKDWMDAKQYGKFVTFAIASNFLVNAIEKVTGQKTGFNPLGSLAEGISNSLNDTGSGENVLPLAGDILGNIPGGSLLIRGIEPPVREKIFGDYDPAKYDRYGTGVPLISAVQPAYKIAGDILTWNLSPSMVADAAKIISTFALPFGGKQIDKTFRGASYIGLGGQYKDGSLQFPTDPDAVDKAKALIFGPYANDNAQLYFDQQLNPLTSEETRFWESRVKAGGDPTREWLNIQEAKVGRRFRDKVRDIMKNTGLSPQEQAARVDEEKVRYEATIQLLRNYQP